MRGALASQKERHANSHSVAPNESQEFLVMDPYWDSKVSILKVDLG